VSAGSDPIFRRGEWGLTPFPFVALLIAAPAAAQPAISAGERAFQRCYACHDLGANPPALQGPGLRGVFGRRAGTLPGFDYSPALRAAGARGLAWDAGTLDRYLEDPAALVPGGAMDGVWVRDPDERRALIEWLAQATR
jgi:cytochrome c